MPDTSPPPSSDSPSTLLASFFKSGDRAVPPSAGGLVPGTVVGDFRLERLLGRGGMGEVWEATERSLARRVALKFVRPERVTPRQLELFAREARAGGRLAHPGLVAVHGHGRSDGMAWISMELVRGSWTLRHFLNEVGQADELPPDYDRRVAGFVSEVAEAMAAAHDAGVIHRDLKPQNILVTRENRPKVTDFGLARIVDETALSVTGEFAGTYFYMSPEQVAAKRAGIDHRTDVFSLGVVLYEMLTFRRPFQGDTHHQVAEQILVKDPPDARTIRSKVPRELAVIASKALEKDRDRRYATMAELAEDLRRWLADVPILAQPPTALERGVKWCRRHPTATVAGALVAVALLAISTLAVALLASNRDLEARETELVEANASLERERAAAQASAQLAASEAARADREAEEARHRADEVLRLAALRDVADLFAEAERLWPAGPELVPRYEDWIERAEALLDDRTRHAELRASLQAIALPRTEEERLLDRETHPERPSYDAVAAQLEAGRERILQAPNEGVREAMEQELARLEAERVRLDAVLDERRTWTFGPERPEARWWESQLGRLVAELDRLERTHLDPQGVVRGEGWGVARRLAHASTIRERSLDGPDARRRWQETAEALAADWRFEGLDLAPQLGLLPLGRDPATQLPEFAHLESGTAPVRDADDRLVLDESTGLVFVLVPGGEFWMGAQPFQRGQHNYDPEAEPAEQPIHLVRVSPFFLSKYELTQAQWERLSGENPSAYGPARFAQGWDREKPHWTGLHPVEQVSWDECAALLDRLGLVLPTEARWEYAARAGTETPWSTGRTVAELQGYANFNDAWGHGHGNEAWPNWEPELDDGNSVHAEVGRFLPNPFGLHDVHGNVFEWCLDGWLMRAWTTEPRVDPVVSPALSNQRVIRGGAFHDKARFGRSSYRSAFMPGTSHVMVGLRPAREIDG